MVSVTQQHFIQPGFFLFDGLSLSDAWCKTLIDFWAKRSFSRNRGTRATLVALKPFCGHTGSNLKVSRGEISISSCSKSQALISGSPKLWFSQSSLLKFHQALLGLRPRRRDLVTSGVPSLIFPRLLDSFQLYPTKRRDLTWNPTSFERTSFKSIHRQLAVLNLNPILGNYSRNYLRSSWAIKQALASL